MLLGALLYTSCIQELVISNKSISFDVQSGLIIRLKIEFLADLKYLGSGAVNGKIDAYYS